MATIIRKNASGDVIEEIPARFIAVDTLTRLGQKGGMTAALRSKLWRLRNPDGPVRHARARKIKEMREGYTRKTVSEKRKEQMKRYGKAYRASNAKYEVRRVKEWRARKRAEREIHCRDQPRREQRQVTGGDNGAAG